jgi:hypothetical protein
VPRKPLQQIFLALLDCEIQNGKRNLPDTSRAGKVLATLCGYFSFSLPKNKLGGSLRGFFYEEPHFWM